MSGYLPMAFSQNTDSSVIYYRQTYFCQSLYTVRTFLALFVNLHIQLLRCLPAIQGLYWVYKRNLFLVLWPQSLHSYLCTLALSHLAFQYQLYLFPGPLVRFLLFTRHFSAKIPCKGLSAVCKYSTISWLAVPWSSIAKMLSITMIHGEALDISDILDMSNSPLERPSYTKLPRSNPGVHC